MGSPNGEVFDFDRLYELTRTYLFEDDEPSFWGAAFADLPRGYGGYRPPCKPERTERYVVVAKAKKKKAAKLARKARRRCRK